jgi:hypothetical protein
MTRSALASVVIGIGALLAPIQPVGSRALPGAR